MTSYTPFTTITSSHATITSTFASHKTQPVEFRKVQLRKLYWSLKDHESEIFAALDADLGKPSYETYTAEYGWLLKDVLDMLKNLDGLVADEAGEAPFIYKLMSPRVKKHPLGAVLVIGAFNYPFQLTFGPLIGAIAAGCTAVVKPSEMTPESARVTASIISRLDPTCYATVLGAVEETTKLLELKWDKICYTGNSAVARIVAAAAAKHLTPTLLELGGLNPVMVTSSADAKLAARRTIWTKIHNCGQICVAADYALVHPSAEAAFIEGYKASIAEFLPNGTYDPKNYGHIVNRRHFDRITGLLARSAGKTIIGGQSDGEKLWIEPTLVRVDSPQDALLSEEIFGPVLPYLLVDTTTEMCSLVAQIGDTPLAVYAFTNDKAEQEQILTTTRSGGATINDAMFHAVIQTMPFGGVGESGSGCYRGKHSFHAFTHRRSLANQPGWTEGQLRVRYPPYSDALLNKFKRTSGLGSPNFDREGKAYKVPVWKRLAFLGASGVKGGLVRYVLTLMGAWVLSGYLNASK